MSSSSSNSGIVLDDKTHGEQMYKKTNKRRWLRCKKQQPKNYSPILSIMTRFWCLFVQNPEVNRIMQKIVTRKWAAAGGDCISWYWCRWWKAAAEYDRGWDSASSDAFLMDPIGISQNSNGNCIWLPREISSSKALLWSGSESDSGWRGTTNGWRDGEEEGGQGGDHRLGILLK